MNRPILSDAICSEDRITLETQFESARAELKRLVRSKLDRRLTGRVDPSDIVQETYVDAFRRYPEYLSHREVPLIDWLRFLAVQSVKASHRFHIGRQKRDVNCERTNIAGSSLSKSIVETLSSSQTTPQTAALRTELRTVVEQKLEDMSRADQEIIRMRHEELLSNQECAERLGLSLAAASKRYLRAIQALRNSTTDYLS